MVEIFEPSFESNYFVYCVEATEIVEPSSVIETVDIYVPGMFQYRCNTSRNSNSMQEKEEVVAEDTDDSKLEFYEDDLCVGVRRRAMYEPSKFGHRHWRRRYCLNDNVRDINVHEEDNLRAFIANTRENIAALDRFRNFALQAAEATNIELAHAGEGNLNNEEEDVYYSVRNDYPLISVLEKGATVVNTVDDGPHNIPLYERAYQWFKDLISIHLTLKWKILVFSVLSMVFVVYFAIVNPLTENGEIPLVNWKEPTTAPTDVKYYPGLRGSNSPTGQCPISYICAR